MKEFLDVFPGLHMTDQMQELLSLVGVERVSMPRDRSSLRIYLNSPRSVSYTHLDVYKRQAIYDLRGVLTPAR